MSDILELNREKEISVNEMYNSGEGGSEGAIVNDTRRGRQQM